MSSAECFTFACLMRGTLITRCVLCQPACDSTYAGQLPSEFCPIAKQNSAKVLQRPQAMVGCLWHTRQRLY
eukprot:3236217-Amphidinium_carterae.1